MFSFKRRKWTNPLQDRDAWKTEILQIKNHSIETCPELEDIFSLFYQISLFSFSL